MGSVLPLHPIYAQISGERLMEADGANCTLAYRMDALERRVEAIPIPSAEGFTCPRCRKRGHLKTTVWCGCCQAPFTTEVRRQ